MWRKRSILVWERKEQTVGPGGMTIAVQPDSITIDCSVPPMLWKTAKGFYFLNYVCSVLSESPCRRRPLLLLLLLLLPLSLSSLWWTADLLYPRQFNPRTHSLNGCGFDAGKRPCWVTWLKAEVPYGRMSGSSRCWFVAMEAHANLTALLAWGSPHCPRPGTLSCALLGHPGGTPPYTHIQTQL